MSNPHLEALVLKIREDNRPERKFHQSRITNACRVRQLVLAHRYTFPVAVKKLSTKVEDMLESFLWLSFDNIALNAKFSVRQFHMSRYELETLEWFQRLLFKKGQDHA